MGSWKNIIDPPKYESYNPWENGFPFKGCIMTHINLSIWDPIQEFSLKALTRNWNGH